MIEGSALVADRYRIDARIGGGGMADVFEARDEALDRDVAIKLLRGIDDPAAARRFAEEIRLTARLNHPNVVQLFDAGEHDGAPFLVLERVTGGTLAQAMDGGMAPQLVAEIGRQTAAALEHAHHQGVVHRDVKPSNILLTAEGTVRLADFGIALTATATRLTVAGSVAGSAGYVSPEQVLGTGAGAPSDVYALGLVLLECLTGAPPWSGTTVEVALARITADPPIPDTVPESWRGLLTAMTTRQPENRPSMGAVAAALGDLAEDRDTPLFPLPTAPARTRRFRIPVAAAGALLLLGTGALLSMNPPDAAVSGPASTPAAVVSDGVISASVLGGAAVGEEASSADDGQSSASGDGAPARTRRGGSGKSSGQGSGTADATTLPVDVPVRAPKVTAPAPAAKPAPAASKAQERTRATRDTVTTPPARDRGNDADAAADSPADADADARADGDGAAEDTTGTGDVADTTPKGNGKAKGAKTRGPGIGAPNAASTNGVLK